MGIAHSKEKKAILTPENRIIVPAPSADGDGDDAKVSDPNTEKIPEARIVHLEAFRYLSLYCTWQKEGYAFASVQLRLSV